MYSDWAKKWATSWANWVLYLYWRISLCSAFPCCQRLGFSYSSITGKPFEKLE